MNTSPEKRLANSDLAAEMVNLLQEEEKYAREISEELGTPRESVHSYIKLLRDEGLIKRGFIRDDGRFVEAKDKEPIGDYSHD